MIYIDPPFFGLFYYEYNFEPKDHEDLANLVKLQKGKVLLKYHYFSGLEDLYPRDKFVYHKKEYPIPSTLKIKEERERKVLYFISNYERQLSLF